MNETLELLMQHRIVPAVVLDDRKQAKPLTDALINGGLPVVEVTLRTPESLAAMERILERRDLIVGAGTVTTLSQFDAAWRLGARFIVTPGLDENIVRHGWRRDLLVIPGAVTPTEIMHAQNLGIKLVKFFPSHVFGGLEGIEALAGPFPKMRFMPSGGISLDNLASYLSSPHVCACAGSWMARREWLQAGAWSKVQDACAASVGLVEKGEPAPTLAAA